MVAHKRAIGPTEKYQIRRKGSEERDMILTGYNQIQVLGSYFKKILSKSM